MHKPQEFKKPVSKNIDQEKELVFENQIAENHVVLYCIVLWDCLKGIFIFVVIIL